MAIPPPTILHQASPRVRIAPDLFITVSAERDATVADLMAVLRNWTGDGEERTVTWASFAAEHRLVAHDDQPFCAPDFAFSGRHRWVAVAVEAPREVHVYAGLCAAADGTLPSPALVAGKAADLVRQLGAGPLRRGREKIPVEVRAGMYIRGAGSGRQFRLPRGYAAVAREPETLREAVPLFTAAFGGLFSAGAPPGQLSFKAYGSTLGVAVLAYLVLSAIRWRSDASRANWVSLEWPE